MNSTITEPERNIPIIHETDICVLGGSATGVFAAVRAARLGAKVAIVEKQNCFGGAATCGMVNIWHSPFDTEGKRRIIGGLTQETIERLEKRGAVSEGSSANTFYRLNTEELKIDLDEMIVEAGVRPFLHTSYVAPHQDDGELAAVIIENKSGRAAIRARMFIDATGDGDLCAHLNIPHETPELKQPPTTGAKISGLDDLGDFNWKKAVLEHLEEYKLPEITGWNMEIPDAPGVKYLAETKIYGANCADADSLTHCEIEGRRQVRAIMDIIRRFGPADSNVALLGLSSYIGIRETRHFRCMHQLTEQEVLDGVRFPDAIANGTYRVDIHRDEDSSIVFRYLDGREMIARVGRKSEWGRWRPETEVNPKFYQIPYRCLAPGGFENVLVCGRAIDADKGAFGAIRVMVNTNQTGEAAGVAAVRALEENAGVDRIDIEKLRRTMADGGSIII